ncbi:MAG: DMT family transporter [Alphaproteobacteria bacterium]|jgi:drug/metabolite transporter (DMT)-like permease|nr:DMT family transporter [Alphaproteobacteria bacterium]
MFRQSTTRDPAIRGILYMVLSCGLLTCNDGLMKWVAETQPVGQIVFVRGLFVLLPIAALAWRAGGWTALRVRNVKGQAASAALLTVSLFLFVTALPLMPLADAIVIIYVSPIIVIVLAPRLLGEQIGWRRWSAVVVGFAGVALVMRPEGGRLDWVVFLPLVVAVLLAFRDILMRRLVSSETSVSILLTANTVSALCGLATSTLGWPPIGLAEVGLLALAGLLFGLAQFLMSEAFRHADAGLAAPFRYSSVVWAILFGYAVWRELPDLWAVAGIVLIIASGLFILHREARRRRS